MVGKYFRPTEGHFHQWIKVVIEGHIEKDSLGVCFSLLGNMKWY